MEQETKKIDPKELENIVKEKQSVVKSGEIIIKDNETPTPPIHEQ